jgi:hypothetical protein
MIRTLVLVATLVVGGPASAATIVQRTLDLDATAGRLVEHRHMTVLITENGDRDSWGLIPIYVNDHVTLDRWAISVHPAGGGKPVEVRKRDLMEQSATSWELYSSGRVLVADLPPLSIGDRIEYSVTRTFDPLYGDDWHPILRSDPQDSLRITLKGGPQLRWTLRRAGDLVTVTESDIGIVVEGSNLPARSAPDLAADTYTGAPSLWFSWDAADTWAEVAAWYADITADLERGSESIRSLARTLTEGAESPRAKVLALTTYAASTIRYEAVEIGPGGWIPTPAREVVERGWGDCKDKSELLRDLLEAVGIPARLVLIHLGRHGDTDPNFPATIGFNHCILAVDAEAAGAEDTDPVSDGWWFVDPTMDRGTAAWLHADVQGQWGLVSDTENGALVRLPARPEREIRWLSVEGTTDENGDFTGIGRLALSGDRAVAFVRAIDREPPDRIEEYVRTSFQSVVPGGEVGQVGWSEIDGDLPRFQLEAHVRQTGMVTGASTPRMRPSLLSALPNPRTLEERDEAVILRPGFHRTQWRIHLPDVGCVARPTEESVKNGVGRFEQTVTDDAGVMVVDRTVMIYRRFVGVESLEHLRELAVAESRADRRSVRLTCGE